MHRFVFADLEGLLASVRHAQRYRAGEEVSATPELILVGENLGMQHLVFSNLEGLRAAIRGIERDLEQRGIEKTVSLDSVAGDDEPTKATPRAILGWLRAAASIVRRVLGRG